MDNSWIAQPYRWENPSEEHREAWMSYGDFFQNHWDNDGRISPLDLYCYLKARFGNPNGVFMATRHPTTKNIVQWHYVVARGSRVMHFIAYNDKLRVIPQTDRLPGDKDWAALAEALKREYAKLGQPMGVIRRSMQKWDLFTNPFCRLKNILDEYAGRLKSLQELPTPAINAAASEEEVRDYSQKMSEYWKRRTVVDGLCLSIRMLAPVAAEAFVNLVIYLLAKQSIREDSDLLKATLRTDIPTRLEQMAAVCDGFVRPIDTAAAPLKAFFTMMNERNFYLHGNFDPEKLSFDTFHMDTVTYGSTHHQIPLFKRSSDLGDHLARGVFQDMQPTQAVSDMLVVDGLIQCVLGYMDPAVAKDVVRVMSVAYPAREQGTGRIDVVLPHVIASCPIFGTQTPTHNSA